MFVPKAILKGQLQRATFLMSVLIFALVISKDVKQELADWSEMMILSPCLVVCLSLMGAIVIWRESILLL
jgi:hypothetical protein